MKRMYGVITAMVTPFTADDKVDVPALKMLTDYLIGNGVHCLYPCGTTGEMLKMSLDERKLVAETVMKQAAGKALVFIHVGAATTKDTIDLAKHAAVIGTDGIGVVTPQFFGVNDREMEEFYVAVANSVPADFPVYLYGIPQCAGNDIKPEVIEKILLRTKNVVGIKYSWADMIRMKNYLLCNNGNFDVVAGPDRLFLPALAQGCVGTVSGCSNCGPAPFVEVYKKFLAGDIEGARKAQVKTNELCEIVKSGASMAVFKAAMEFNGLPATHMRAPALDLTKDEKKDLYAQLDAFKKKYK